MDLAQARLIVTDPAASMMKRIEAAHLISVSDHSTLEDLVACLRCRGVIASLAAAGLYRRAGRERRGKLRDLANVDQWEQFLIKRRLLSEGASD